eukprot:GHVQ01019523.1.p2 GENE.GHVQ01019523.1~~GHVQ01019523.1.p2  ORF type:complete len:105 (-),score=8.94 GHVQ01019523.1:105-419(-)
MKVDKQHCYYCLLEEVTNKRASRGIYRQVTGWHSITFSKPLGFSVEGTGNLTRHVCKLKPMNFVELNETRQQPTGVGSSNRNLLPLYFGQLSIEQVNQYPHSHV